MRRPRSTLLATASLTLLGLVLPACASDATPAPNPAADRVARDSGVQLVRVASLGDSATAAAMHKGDPRLYVALQGGKVVAVGKDGSVATVLDMTALTESSGEQGLLGVAIAPNGKHLYVDYTDKAGNTNVDEYAMRPGAVSTSTRRRVLYQSQPYPNHNGGNIVFGPDGYLYVALGDGGSAGDPQRRGQDLSTLLGKILRIDPRKNGRFAHRIPKGNPFVTVRGARKEIWSYGLRNPWKFSFDRATNNLWIGDVGQDTIEEVDHVGSGRGVNFGWSAYEGTNRFNDDQSAPNATMPVYQYKHSGSPGGCAITGGYVYRGKAIPSLLGTYLFADFCTNGVRALDPANPGAGEHSLTSSPGSIVSFAQGTAGELYVLTEGGAIYRLAPA